MGTLYISAGLIGTRGATGSDVAVYNGPVAGEALTTNTSSAASASMTGPATTGLPQVAEFYSATHHRVAVNGTASATVGIYVPANSPRHLTLPAGGTISAIELA